MIAKKFIHPSRKTAAFAKWQFPYTSTPLVEAEKARLQKNTHEDHPQGYNVELYDQFFESIGQKSAKWVHNERDFSMSIHFPRGKQFPLSTSSSSSFFLSSDPQKE